MKSNFGSKRFLFAIAVSAVLIAVSLLPTGCVTLEPGGGGGGANPSVIRQAQIESATVCPQATPAEMDDALSVSASVANDALSCVVSPALCVG